MKPNIPKAEAIADLRAELKPGDTVYTVLRHVSSSGMYRAIDLYTLRCVEGKVSKRWLSYWAAAALEERFDERREAIGVSGAGMDMGWHLVYQLSSALFP